MCGITGAIVREATAADALDVDAAIDCLQHRGPDQRGAWREAEAHLGFRRLSIIDLSECGDQPMASPDGRYVIVFNGEIYNFPTLRAELEAQGETFRGH